MDLEILGGRGYCGIFDILDQFSTNYACDLGIPLFNLDVPQQGSKIPKARNEAKFAH